MPSNRKMEEIRASRNRGNPDGGQRFNSGVNAPIDPAHTQSPGSGRQQYSHTYIGIVKRKDDPDRMGRIAVYIKEIHGKENDPHALTWCDYASPFAGGTPTKDIKPQNNYNASQDSYGMWFPMPDIDNQVLVTFVNGDLNRGVWFACLYKQKTNAMVPDSPATLTEDGVSVGGNPVRDINTTANVETSAKPKSAPLARGLTRQGLIKDDIRGRSTSSSNRQNVSTVYGIRTPRGSGVVFDDGYKTDPNPARDETAKSYNPNVAENGGNRANKAKENELSSVNTPGISDRTSEYIRMRTRSGAQILIHETEGIIYLINRDGTSWVEMSRAGKIDVYAQDSVSVHSYGSINMTAQEDVNIEAGRNINMKARGTGSVNSQRGQGNIYVESAANTHFTTGADMRLLVGKNQEVLVANNINVRSDNWDQNVNLDYQLCICENQDIKVGKNKHEFIQGTGDTAIGDEDGKGGYSLTIGSSEVPSSFNVEVWQDTDIFTQRDFHLQSGNDSHLVVGNDGYLQTGNDLHQFVSNDYYETTENNKERLINGNMHVAFPQGGVKNWGQAISWTISDAPCIVPSPQTTVCSDALPDSATPGTTPLEPDTPADPANPILAIQPFVNSLRENKTYTASISNRVPEHEPWEGHTEGKPPTHEAYSGNPDDNLETIQQDQAKPPAGSPAFQGSPQGGPPKGNNSPVPATQDIDKVQENINDALQNSAKVVSTGGAGALMDTEVTNTSITETTPIVEQLVSDIKASDGSPAAISALIAGAQVQATDALTAVQPETGLPLIDQVVNGVTEFADDVTGVAKEAMDFISTDVISGTLDAVNSAIAEISDIASDIYDEVIPEQEAVDSTLASVEQEVSGAVNGLVDTVSNVNISETGKEMIASFEKYVPFEFPDGFTADGAARTAIGYGHQLAGAAEDITAQFEAGLTEEEAWKVLTEKDLPALEAKLKRQFKRGVAQNELDAFVSFAYNRGVNNPAVKKAITAFNKNDMEGVASQFMSHAGTAGGKLIGRREAELNTLLKGEYKVDLSRTELKKIGLKEYLVEAWEGEHPWKNLGGGYLHKEFPVEDTTKRVVQQAALVYNRTSEKTEFALPETLPENKLTEMVGGVAKLEKAQKEFVDKFDKVNAFFGRA